MAALTLIHDAPACEWHPHKAWTEEVVETLPAGTVGKYRGHTVGGMVHIEVDGRHRVIHPATTKELS